MLEMNPDISNRGKFRSVEMDDLEKWADSPLWDDGETKGKYVYPLSIFFDDARKKGEQLAAGIPVDETYRRGPFVCAKSPASHLGPFKHAVDFLVPDGTGVLAAADGTIVEVEEWSNSWGPTSEYRDHLNYLTIKHDNGEFSQYCHLARQSVARASLTIGSRVKQGQHVAEVAKTGWTDRDHLHFVVFRSAQNESPFTFKSLRVRFVDILSLPWNGQPGFCFSIRLSRFLEQKGIKTVGQLVTLTEEDLGNHEVGGGRKCVMETKEALATLDLTLRAA